VLRWDNPEMSTKRRNIWFWSTVAVGVLLVAYPGAYFALCRTDSYPDVTYRKFRSRAECRIFSPLAWIECQTRETIVILEVSADHDRKGNLHDGPRMTFRP
jgi:hypothetical protein